MMPKFFITSDAYPSEWSAEGTTPSLAQKVKEQITNKAPNSICAACAGGKGNTTKVELILGAIREFTGIELSIATDTLVPAPNHPWVIIDVKTTATASLLIKAGVLFTIEKGFLITFRRLSSKQSQTRHFNVKVFANNRRPLDPLEVKRSLCDQWHLPDLSVQVALLTDNNFYVKVTFQPGAVITLRKTIFINTWKFELRYADDCKICHSQDHPTKECLWTRNSGRSSWKLDVGELAKDSYKSSVAWV
jgi:hypothetical protein